MQKIQENPMIGFREKLRTDTDRQRHRGQSRGPTSRVGGSKKQVKFDWTHQVTWINTWINLDSPEFR
jgi:hypothetical protein